MTVSKWDRFEARFKGPETGNPFAEVEFSAVFSKGNRRVPARGFYDGRGEYAIRLMPDAEGEWTYVTKSNAPALDGLTGGFTCAPAASHGPVVVARADVGALEAILYPSATRLAYADGAKYSCVGTTCYCWTHQGEELESKTLETLSKGYFNKIRMCVFPKHYVFNHNDPEFYPFVGGKRGDGYEWDFEKFDPAYWAHLEKRIDQLAGMGIEADLILFHPYDRWGFSNMPHATDLFYLRYAVARLSSFRNVWWSFANEYDLMKGKTTSDWDEFFRLVQAEDPAQHLRSIHNCRAFYDHSKPWVTHCSVQSSDIEKVPEWLERYEKPVVIDECCYEGDIPNQWGNITAQEMVNRMWTGFSLGGYVGHGETYLSPDEVLWWARGGVLHGQAPERIKFLKNIFEQLPENSTPAKEFVHIVGLNFADEKFLYYYGIRQPSLKEFRLPEGKKYRAEIFDAWNMTVTPVEGALEGFASVALPGKPYCGVIMTRIN